MRFSAVGLFLALLAPHVRADVEADVDDVLIHYRAYVDAGYINSSTRPANRIWRSKYTTFRVDQIELNLAMAMLWKPSTAESRWGFGFGVQAGVDTELAIPGADSGLEPIGGADVLQYFHRVSLTYLLPVGDGLSLTAGLIPAPPGYESFLSMDNPTYTRGYITDYVPYFVIGIEADYPIHPCLARQRATHVYPDHLRGAGTGRHRT